MSNIIFIRMCLQALRQSTLKATDHRHCRVTEILCLTIVSFVFWWTCIQKKTGCKNLDFTFVWYLFGDDYMDCCWKYNGYQGYIQLGVFSFCCPVSVFLWLGTDQRYIIILVSFRKVMHPVAVADDPDSIMLQPVCVIWTCLYLHTKFAVIKAG